MKVIGAELLERQATVKFVMNGGAIVFFFATQQHRDIKSDGVSYEDDYRGNAVAGIVSPARVEIRFHKAYSDDRIRTLWCEVLATPEMADRSLGTLVYQGREIR